MSATTRSRRPVGLAILLMIGGVVGWIAAFALTLEKFAALGDPGRPLACDFSLLVQCGANLDSPQGSVFGFPNPLIGLSGFVAPVVVGAALLAGARFARWFRLAFATGMTAATVFVAWLIGQSIYVLGTLCPWCMVVWAVTIPMFWAVLLRALGDGTVPLPAALRRVASVASGWLPTLTFASYLLIAVLAQLRLDVIGHL